MIMKFLKLKVNYRIKCTIRQRKASQLTHTHTSMPGLQKSAGRTIKKTNKKCFLYLKFLKTGTE